jgi:hypothetical protein
VFSLHVLQGLSVQRVFRQNEIATYSVGYLFMTSSPTTENIVRYALLGMMAATGLVDAVSFLSLGRVFTANMTGNVVILAFATARIPGLSIARSLTALLFDQSKRLKRMIQQIASVSDAAKRRNKEKDHLQHERLRRESNL